MKVFTLNYKTEYTPESRNVFRQVEITLVLEIMI